MSGHTSWSEIKNRVENELYDNHRWLWYYCLAAERRLKRISPRRLQGDLIHIKQRIERGWSFQDAWGADWHMHKIHIGMLRHLADVAHGWPGEEYMTFDEYTAMLREIADAFELELQAIDEYRELTPQEVLRVDDAWNNFRHWYWSFRD